MRAFFTILTLLALPVLAGPSWAASAIAMHGTPAYGEGATHFDYANPDAPKGGTLHQSVIGSFDTLNPFTLKGTAAAGLEYIYDRLAARAWGEPFSLYGLIAQNIIVPDDRSSITFQLNPAARFHDGVPITAADVKFTFETLKQFGRPNMRRVYKIVSKVRISDPHTIRFDLGPGHDRETVMILAMMPVLPKHIWQDHPFDQTTLKTPIGSGPYRITQMQPGRRIVYERVKDDWAADNISRKGHNNFERLVFDYYRDNAVALEAFKAHDVDIRREYDTARWHTAYNDIAPDIKLEALGHDRPEKVKGFIFNTRRAPFDDLRVRRAINLAFDADFINTTLYHGTGKRIYSIFPYTKLQNPTLKAPALPRRAAMRAASKLLQDAGWVIKNGARVNAKTGTPMAFQILLSSALDEKIALALTSGLKKLGITPTIRTVDAAQFAGALGAYDYDIVLHYWYNSLSPGTEQMIYWGCAAANTPGSKNYAGLCNPKIDLAAKQVAQAKTYQDLRSSAQTLDKLVMNQVPFIPLFAIGCDYWAYWDDITHPQITPLYGSVIQTWWHK